MGGREEHLFAVIVLVKEGGGGGKCLRGPYVKGTAAEGGKKIGWGGPNRAPVLGRGKRPGRPEFTVKKTCSFMGVCAQGRVRNPCDAATAMKMSAQEYEKAVAALGGDGGPRDLR